MFIGKEQYQIFYSFTRPSDIAEQGVLSADLILW